MSSQQTERLRLPCGSHTHISCRVLPWGRISSKLAEWALRISGATMGQSSPCNHGPTQPLQPWAKAAPWARAAMGHMSGPLQPWAKAAPRLQGQSKQPQGWQGTAAPLPCHHRKNKNVARVQTAEGTQRADRADSRGQMAGVGQTARADSRVGQTARADSRWQE